MRLTTENNKRSGDTRLGGRGLLLHLHPRDVPEAAIAAHRTWGLGGMALVLFGVLVLSGTLTMLVYEPTPANAYNSILVLQEQISFGRWVRNIHHWSGNLMVVVTVLHMLRVFFTGGFTGKRRGNWWIGMGLLACVLVMAFTGYLLPWDQLSYWAITISTGMLGYVPGIGAWLQVVVRGGTDIAAEALRNFFTLHTSVVPAAMVILLGFHFWRVRKAGGVVLPAESTLGTRKISEDRVPSYPDLLARETAVALSLIAAILIFAVFVDAPLGPAANPGLSPNPAKAPWYFLGLQELLIHVQPLFAVLIIPCLGILGLAFLPCVPLGETETGIWFRSRVGGRSSAVTTVFAFISVPAAILLDNGWYHGGAALASFPHWLSGGVLPLAVSGAVGTGGVLWMRQRCRMSPAEAIQAIFVFLLVTLVLLTITGVWFRGPGMELVWPGKGVS